MTNKDHVRDYSSALAYLGNKQLRPLQLNTYLVRQNDYAIDVIYHNTSVVTYYKDGQVKLRHNSWLTKTTKDRINTYASHYVHIYQHKHIWYIQAMCYGESMYGVPVYQYDMRKTAIKWPNDSDYILIDDADNITVH